jgi:hypothetical protein
MVVRSRLCVICCLIVLASSFASATSVVAKLGLRRIILEADTRGGLVAPGVPDSHHDDVCKIIPLGRSALAVSGNESYKSGINDLVPDWDALSDAKSAYAMHGNVLHELAQEWARRSAAFYTWFYLIAPQRVKELASVNPQHVLIDAFVVGWQGQVPIVYWELVCLDQNSAPPIQISEVVLPLRETPYTTNRVTRELLEGDSQRTTDAAAQWKKMSLGVPATELDWRWMEFVIKSTNRYDGSVAPDVNVIQIPFGGRAEWIQNLTCPD